MHVEDPPRPMHLVGQGLDRQRPHGDRGHEMPVHHVDVDDSGPRLHDLLDL